MPPSLTETWSSAFFQSTLTLLIFALGIPAIVLQISLSPEVQRLASRRILGGGRWTLVGMCLYVSALLSYVWIFHPIGTSSTPRDWTASAILSVAVVLTVALWWDLLSSSSRENILKKLQRKAILQHGVEYRIRDAVVADIVFLGVRGRPGQEKNLALESLRYCIDRVQRTSAFQRGYLESVIMGIEEILSSREIPANDENFNLGCEILNSVVGRSDTSDGTDFLLAVRALMRMGSLSARVCSDRITLTYLESMSVPRIPCRLAARGIYHLGMTALESSRFLTALASLSRLESIVDSETSAETSDSRFHLIGLVAHFWRISSSARGRLAKSLAAVSTGPLAEHTRTASLYFAEAGDFTTADMTLELAADLGALHAGHDNSQQELPLVQ